MTVRELIELLEEVNPNYTVMSSSRRHLKEYHIYQDDIEQKVYLNY